MFEHISTSSGAFHASSQDWDDPLKSIECCIEDMKEKCSYKTIWDHWEEENLDQINSCTFFSFFVYLFIYLCLCIKDFLDSDLLSIEDQGLLSIQPRSHKYV